MSDDLVKRAREGVIERPKRWTGDTHDGLGGSVDYDATDALMNALADRIESLETRAEKAEAWNRAMVEKAASGGTLDGYREMGAKLAAIETREERIKAERDAASRSLEHLGQTVDYWARRANEAEAERDALREALLRVGAALAATTSLLEAGGRKAAPSDKMFNQMLSDYRAALNDARTALNRET